jgi:hypothetical protein
MKNSRVDRENNPQPTTEKCQPSLTPRSPSRGENMSTVTIASANIVILNSFQIISPASSKSRLIRMFVTDERPQPISGIVCV